MDITRAASFSARGLDPGTALITGAVAGVIIAAQFGAVSVLLVETAVAGGPRLGVAAGMGVATADFLFAVVATAAGGAAQSALEGHETEVRLVAAAVLAAIALHGLLAYARRGEGPAPAAAAHRTHYARFLALTAVNPLTIVSFAAIAAALSFGGPAAAAAFAVGVGVGSATWHLVLTVAAGHAGRWMSTRVRRGVAVGGRLAVLAIAATLALGA
jgi:threonine/homoserine/homoserine lactone efflux protein